MQRNLLRTLVLSSVLCLMSFVSKAQWVSIPDANFRAWLNTNGFSSCMNGNFMDTTCNAVISAGGIDCSWQQITDLTGIQYFDNLDTLFCVANQLNILPPLPNSLTVLWCGNSQLSSLPTLPNFLRQLSCDNNQFTSLPALPNSLTYLRCSYNPLTSLPTLPNSLTTLYCESNQLTSLPALPNSLTSLTCNHNQLNVLPALPHSLTQLVCQSNQLNSLPVLPNSLTWLDCSYNQISSLPALPYSLTQLYCYYNQLSSLSELPDSLNVFYCHNNQQLFCLPQLKKIKDFNFGNTGITCLPNYPQFNVSSYPVLNTVPLCNVSNTHGCAVYWNITGNIYVDGNANCSYDTGENNAFLNVKMQLYQNGILQQQQNIPTGSYSFDTDLGTYSYSIDTTNLPFIFACPDSGYYTSNITALDSFDTDMNFGLRCKPGFDLVAQSIYSGFVPGRVRKVNVSAGDATNFYGAHCAAGTSGSVQLIINGAAHYASAASGALTPTSIVNDTITWSIADFGAVNFFHDFNINVATDTTAVLGSQICFTLIVNPIAGDNNPANNILTHCFTVIGSWDPNEKEVYPAGNIDTATHWLTYTIHFQNTGTAEAQHIYVTDTLDSNIDAASFQLLAYSHQPMVQLKGNNLRFNFPNINLPDSNTNEPLSRGYVQYKVKLKDNLPIGTSINNTAFIYFDFNSPVVTNTTSNTIALATGVANLGIQNADFGLNPNPATESVRISVDESMIGSNLTITDITGREVLHSAVQIPARTTDDVQSGGRNPQFDIRNLSPGVYFVTLENKTGRVTKKLVKQ